VVRFHHETLETASKEIDLKGVTIAVGRTEVIADSHLRLKNGVKYALMGRSVLLLQVLAVAADSKPDPPSGSTNRNGSGKSTLLLALRDGLIPGLPANVRFELVSQTEADSTSEESKTISALQKVVNSDRTRARALKDFDGAHPSVLLLMLLRLLS
jgi:ATP-binding cassette subfamily F protein 3